MLMILAYFLLLQLFVSSSEGNHVCRERNRPISSKDADALDIVDAVLQQNLILQCHFCEEEDDAQPKNWYKIDKLGSSEPRELNLSMENEREFNRIWVSTDHSLNINNFTENDTGIYYCMSFNQENIQTKYNFFVDLIYNDNTTESESEEFVVLRHRLNLNLEIVTHWDMWSSCEVCGRPHNDGIKKRKGTCRIKITKHSEGGNKWDPEDMKFLNVNEISCRSIKMGQFFPGISNLTRVVPDFIQYTKCEGICNPDANGTNSGWKMGKSKTFKYRKTFVLPEKSHLTIICPESSLENVVIWRRRGVIQKPGFTDNPNIFVDTFHTLYLVDVTKNEEGNYTCQVDDIKMQQIIIHVVGKSRLITYEFVRHLGYLAFMLSLTIPCYCAGLIITWWRRKTFKSYEELLSEYPDSDEFAGLL